MSKKKMTYEELVTECKKLRGIHERAEAEYFLFLVNVERNHHVTWTEAGCATFEQFIRSNELTTMERYRFFEIGLKLTNTEMARTNGSAWVIRLGRAPSPTQQAIGEFASRASAFVEVKGVAPSEETVKDWGREVFGGRGGKHRTVQQASELHRLRAEVKQLRAELAAAKARITELECKPARGKPIKPETRPTV